MDINRKKNFVAMISVVSNTALVAAKLAIGLLIGSISVISEAIHSGVDVFAAIIAVAGVRQSGQPADRQHAYGHGKFENLSGLIQALLIFIAAGWIVWEAIHKLLHPQALDAPGWGIFIMAISSIVNGLVAWMLFKVGNKTDSLALKADAWHCLTDVYTSMGVMAGLLLIQLGDLFFRNHDHAWIDPVAAILVALLIVKAAWDLTVQSLQDLLDQSIPPVEEKKIKEILEAKYPRVIGFHNFRTRKSGATRFVEFHLLVNPQMPVKDSHALHHDIASEIRSHFSETEVMVHIEPCLRNCSERCEANCFDRKFLAKGNHV